MPPILPFIPLIAASISAAGLGLGIDEATKKPSTPTATPDFNIPGSPLQTVVPPTGGSGATAGATSGAPGNWSNWGGNAGGGSSIVNQITGGGAAPPASATGVPSGSGGTGGPGGRGITPPTGFGGGGGAGGDITSLPWLTGAITQGLPSPGTPAGGA